VGGATVRAIKDETGTRIQIDGDIGVAHITGPTEEHINKAEKKINDMVSVSEWSYQKCCWGGVGGRTCLALENS
jgi:polyribonucleotide nucleotidyltransferase